mgnify:CR=1 FL=1
MNINIERIVDGYLLTYCDMKTMDTIKVFKPNLEEVGEYLREYFLTVEDILPEDFSGFVGLGHDSYPEDM